MQLLYLQSIWRLKVRILQVIKFDSPLLLKNYDSLKVEPPKFSSLYNNDGVVKLDISDKFHFYIITTSGDEIKCISENKYVAPNMENKIATDIRKFNGIVLTNRMSYIFSMQMTTERNTA